MSVPLQFVNQRPRRLVLRLRGRAQFALVQTHDCDQVFHHAQKIQSRSDQACIRLAGIDDTDGIAVPVADLVGPALTFGLDDAPRTFAELCHLPAPAPVIGGGTYYAHCITLVNAKCITFYALRIRYSACVKFQEIEPVMDLTIARMACCCSTDSFCISRAVIAGTGASTNSA